MHLRSLTTPFSPARQLNWGLTRLDNRFNLQGGDYRKYNFSEIGNINGRQIHAGADPPFQVTGIEGSRLITRPRSQASCRNLHQWR